WPRHHVSTGFPLYRCTRKSLTPCVSSGWNHTTWPLSSRIIGPAWTTFIFGARKMYPGAVCASVNTRTGGGFRAGRERKCCVGGGGPAGFFGAADFSDLLLQPAASTASATKAGARRFTRGSIISRQCTLTGNDVPRTRPRAASASTATRPAWGGRAIAVSNPVLGTVRRAPTSRHAATAVAPFQLTYAVPWSTATAGRSSGFPVQRKRKARYESAPRP